MKCQLTAIIEKGDRFLIASCPELPEANGQGRTRDAALRDLTDSIQSVLEYRREQELAHASTQVEQTTILVGSNAANCLDIWSARDFIGYEIFQEMG